MRNLLTVLLAAGLLAPHLSEVMTQDALESCACTPAACRCASHDHGSGHSPMCALANGGRCGVESADPPSATLAARLIFVISEEPSFAPLPAEPLSLTSPPARELPGHAEPPKHPPRLWS